MARIYTEDSEFKDSRHLGRFKWGPHEERSGAGAIGLETTVSYWTSTGANALTLADGSEGQEKIIIHATDGGSLVITPANFAGTAPTSTTITMLTAGDVLALVFVKGQWWIKSAWSQTAAAPIAVA
jgi:hypothetical protein